MDVVLRNELPDDYREVENLTREAFWNVYCPGCSEHYLLNVMRQSPDFIDQLDIVAECDGCIVGNVVGMKSYIEGDDGNRHSVVGLGPISVLPSFQRKGIGRRMIERAVDIAEALGYGAIVLCGDPDLYSRYGFEAAGKYGIRTADNKNFAALQVYPLGGNDPAGYSGRYIEHDIYNVDAAAVESFDRNFPTKVKIKDTPTQLRFKEILTMCSDFC